MSVKSDRPTTVVTVQWKNATSMRKQDNFTCSENSLCNIWNFTFSPSPVIRYDTDTGFTKYYKTPFWVMNASVISITIQNHTGIQCTNYTFPQNIVSKQVARDIIQTQKFTSNTFWNLSLPINRAQGLICMNSTKIENRTDMVIIMAFIHTNPTSLNASLVRNIRECKNTSLEHKEMTYEWKINFPILPKCRTRRWLDQLLGEAETTLCIVNTIDSEILAGKQASFGSGVADVFRWEGKWIPNTVHNHELTLRYDQLMLHVVNDTIIQQYTLDSNVSSALHWTICEIRVLSFIQQRINFIQQLQLRNTSLIFVLFNKTTPLDRTWWNFDIKQCSDFSCEGLLTLFDVRNSTIMCPFTVMPLVLGPQLWFPTYYGQQIDEQNKTYVLKNCKQIQHGQVCPSPYTIYEPCSLQHTYNLCQWTVQPQGYTFIQEILHKYVCVASSTVELVIPAIQAPFSVCLQNVSVLQWANNATYHFYEPWISNVNVNLSFADVLTPIILLPSVKKAMQNIAILNKANQQRNLTLLQHKIDTEFLNTNLHSVADHIEATTAHHWWDAFTGWSATARKVFLHPLIYICSVILMLTFLNCGFTYCVYKRTLYPSIRMTSYSEIQT
uniref:Uncharacterized protein LOC117365289 isoform X1 n=1 Tax=Geotrypetes seraphini TaxID=260995 RepID=A0A6P8S0X7_GEOSA|nr:uncharacterized protein LOC117365289 isoform X1 [Geotrypetes seraphini]XP_033811422.1 uncharacterized protein LOC117365289 isoform X1 [Geotrypetes seraphini]